ncbi:MAG: MSMEG_1061 family FMN-dependent PPOX-type flavoprotein [Burkholderiales bacterium]
MDPRFSEVVASEAELRALIGHPSEVVVKGRLGALDDHCRAYIAASPFVVVASANAAGDIDVSPKGDPPGFVQVLDDSMLAIPERPGNRRADTFSNVLQNPRVALIFLVPGKQETLRVSGTATIVRDRWLRDRMAIAGKAPALALVVAVDEASIHCAKCVIRSKLWDSRHWPDLEGVPSLARAIVDQAQLAQSVAEVQAFIDADIRARLY